MYNITIANWRSHVWFMLGKFDCQFPCPKLLVQEAPSKTDRGKVGGEANTVPSLFPINSCKSRKGAWTPISPSLGNIPHIIFANISSCRRKTFIGSPEPPPPPPVVDACALSSFFFRWPKKKKPVKITTTVLDSESNRVRCLPCLTAMQIVTTGEASTKRNHDRKS